MDAGFILMVNEQKFVRLVRSCMPGWRRLDHVPLWGEWRHTARVHDQMVGSLAQSETQIHLRLERRAKHLRAA